jgi:hypothetical protein
MYGGCGRARGRHLVQRLEARDELGQNLFASKHAELGVKFVPDEKCIGGVAHVTHTAASAFRRAKREFNRSAQAHPADVSILTICSSTWWK